MLDLRLLLMTYKCGNREYFAFQNTLRAAVFWNFGYLAEKLRKALLLHHFPIVKIQLEAGQSFFECKEYFLKKKTNTILWIKKRI